jgi:hypothetical protein
MAYGDKGLPTLYGRRCGLQPMSTTVSGSGRAGSNPDFLVGVEAVRLGVTTAETTATNLAAYGVSYITSSVSSGVYTLDPPIPGVEKFVHFGTTGATNYVKTANGELFQSSQGSTFSVIKSTQNVVGTLRLMGLTTAIWGVAPGLSTASFALSTTT